MFSRQFLSFFTNGYLLLKKIRSHYSLSCYLFLEIWINWILAQLMKFMVNWYCTHYLGITWFNLGWYSDVSSVKAFMVLIMHWNFPLLLHKMLRYVWYGSLLHLSLICRWRWRKKKKFSLYLKHSDGCSSMWNVR